MSKKKKDTSKIIEKGDAVIANYHYSPNSELIKPYYFIVVRVSGKHILARNHCGALCHETTDTMWLWKKKADLP